jgi:hypothetical protein
MLTFGFWSIQRIVSSAGILELSEEVLPADTNALVNDRARGVHIFRRFIDILM